MTPETKELLDKVQMAKAAVSVADDQLVGVLKNEKGLPRAQKQIMNEVLQNAFANVKAAEADLARLEELLAAATE